MTLTVRAAGALRIATGFQMLGQTESGFLMRARWALEIYSIVPTGECASGPPKSEISKHSGEWLWQSRSKAIGNQARPHPHHTPPPRTKGLLRTRKLESRTGRFSPIQGRESPRQFRHGKCAQQTSQRSLSDRLSGPSSLGSKSQIVSVPADRKRLVPPPISASPIAAQSP